MLLRQALEQTRAGMPKPVLFNSRIVAADPIDEVCAMVQKGFFDDVDLDTFYNRASTRAAGATGVQAS